MFKLCQNIFLRHKLTQLVSVEKFFNSRLERTRINKLYRVRNAGVDSRHPILNSTLQLSKSNTKFSLKKLTNGTHSSKSHVVYVVRLCAWSIIELNNMRHDRYNIFVCNCRRISSFLFCAKSFIKSVSSNIWKVVFGFAEK